MNLLIYFIDRGFADKYFYERVEGFSTLPSINNFTEIEFFFVWRIFLAKNLRNIEKSLFHFGKSFAKILFLEIFSFSFFFRKQISNKLQNYSIVVFSFSLFFNRSFKWILICQVRTT